MQPTDPKSVMLRARRVQALRDVAAAAQAFAEHIEAGGEVPTGHHLEGTPYWRAMQRASEQLIDHPFEVTPCDCTIPEDWDEMDLLPPNPTCTTCQGSGAVEHWTPAISTPTLIGPAPAPEAQP
jgi:hypothetical protein